MRAVVFRLENNIFGLGAQVHLLSLVAAYAFGTGRTLVAAEEDEWWYAGDDCVGASYHCYFEPLSPCTVHGKHGVANGLDVRKLPLIGEHNEIRDRLVLASIEAEGWLKSSNGYRQSVAPRYAAMGLLWWRTQLISRIFRPREFVQAHARAVANQIQWPHPWDSVELGRIVGVHVRHGDKVLEVKLLKSQLSSDFI